MKYIFWIGLFLGINSVLFFGSEISYQSQTWIDWSAAFDANFSMDNNSGQFSLSRNYNDLKVKWNKAITGRVTFDLGKISTPLKFAYLDWKLFEPLVLSIGLQKTWFGYSPEWKYTLGPVKALADRESASPTADLGLGLGGNILNKVLSYNVQILNGQGYNGNETGVADQFAWGVNVIISPLTNIRIALSYRGAEQNRLQAAGKKYLMDAISAYADARLGKLWILLEYLGKVDDNTTPLTLQSHIQATLGLMISDSMAAYINILNQYESAGIFSQALSLAFNYTPVQGIILKPFAILNVDPGVSFQLGLQTEISFGFRTGAVE